LWSGIVHVLWQFISAYAWSDPVEGVSARVSMPGCYSAPTPRPDRFIAADHGVRSRRDVVKRVPARLRAERH
jgi:hypothetical protein